MNASMVRFGGIAIFVTLLLQILGRIAIGGGIGGRIIGLVAALLLIFGFWATKGYFNSKSYSKADMPILVLIGTTIITTILSVFGVGGGLGGGMSSMGAGGLQILGIIALVITLIMFLSWLWFGLTTMGFGATGGGIWKAIGILYVIAMAGMALGILFVILAAVAKSGGLIAVGGILALVGGLVLLAALIVHGIGLIQGAGKM
ncbi:MAG TPA: hypothetical protein VM325_02855 [Alphaproteobacteria bacterium]|nr:hypothetical protein [Alphaproteobacteria bacterium]